MDHLPSVKLFEGPFLKVPYLADRDYDGGVFDDYPQRRGWDLKRLLSRDFCEHPPEETASFLQTWLFFGTIYEIVEPYGGESKSSFVTEDDQGKKWISTADLDGRLREWFEHANSVAGEEGRVSTLAAKMARCLIMLCTMSDILYGSDSSPLPDEVVLSMKVLGSTIDSALDWYWDIRRPVSWGLKDLAASRMLDQGWCPRDVALTSHYLSDIAMLYASYLKRDYLQQDHSSCSVNYCSVNQIDDTTYRTKHTTKDCRCAHVQPDQEQIRKILDKGQVPVISLTPRVSADGSRTFDIGVKAHRYLRWFVAISHVWSDGLGNSQKNSLPMCQLQMLYDVVVDRWWDEVFGSLEEQFHELKNDPEISESSYDRLHWAAKKVMKPTKGLVNTVRDARKRPISIWIDTLCVPLEKTFRKKAIAELKTVYSGAMFTIVLDSELQRTSSICSPDERLMRIAVSGWMRRAWTFQEGVLANIRLRIKFADGLVDLSKLLGEGDSSADVGIDTYISQNPKVAKAIESLVRKTDEWGGYKQELEKRDLKRNEWKKNYMMSSYIFDQAKEFFSYMQNVWHMPSQSNKSEDGFKADKIRRIVAAWMGLRWRETSRPEDKFIIFATACVTSFAELTAVQRLLNYPIHGRMKLWLSQQFALPAGFLFISGRRYHEEGWGWAPLGITTGDMKDKTIVSRAPEDTFLQVTKLGYLLSISESMKGSTFVFMDTKNNQRCIVKVEQAYIEAVEADYRPPLPQRPSEKETPLDRNYQPSTNDEKPPPLPKRPSEQSPPPLPPRPRPAPSSSSTSNLSLVSQDSFKSQNVPGLSSKSQSSFTSQDSLTGRVSKPKRRIPTDGRTIALILEKKLELSGINDGIGAGALMTVREQNKESITGLFICAVTVEVIQDVTTPYRPEAAVVQVLDETQVWRAG